MIRAREISLSPLDYIRPELGSPNWLVCIASLSSIYAITLVRQWQALLDYSPFAVSVLNSTTTPRLYRRNSKQKRHQKQETIKMASPSPSASLSTSAFMISSQDKTYSSASDDDVASLPSESTSASDLDSLDSDYSDAEEEWRESIEQLELLLTMVLVPFVGKYLGRKCAYWSTIYPSQLISLDCGCVKRIC